MKSIFASFLFVLLLMPVVIYAQSGSQGGNSSNSGSQGGNSSGASSVTLINPLGEQSLIDFFFELLDAILVFAVPIIVFFIILAGFSYVMARGNPGKIGTAHNALLYAIIGGVLILGAYVIFNVIAGTIDAFR
jgi:hypothetical protein